MLSQKQLGYDLNSFSLTSSSWVYVSVKILFSPEERCPLNHLLSVLFSPCLCFPHRKCSSVLLRELGNTDLVLIFKESQAGTTSLYLWFQGQPARARQMLPLCYVSSTLSTNFFLKDRVSLSCLGWP